MKEIENIDKIIKQGLSDFNPPAPPDAWDAISQQLANGTVPNAQGEGLGSGAGGQATTGIWQSIQGLSIATKLVVAVVGVGLGIGVFTWVQDAPKEMYSPASSSSEASNTPRSEPSTAEVKVEVEKPVAKLDSKAKGEKVAPVATAPLKHEEPIMAWKPTSKGKDELPAQEANLGSGSKSNEASLPAKDKQENASLGHKGSIEEAHGEAEPATVLGDKAEGEAKLGEGDGASLNEPVFGNSFSPNGDGKNDFWEIRMEKAAFYRLLVYDRKGVLVYESDQTDKYWNGSNYKTGVDCEVGSYSYVIEYQLDKLDKIKVKRGIINLLR